MGAVDWSRSSQRFLIAILALIAAIAMAAVLLAVYRLIFSVAGDNGIGSISGADHIFDWSRSSIWHKNLDALAGVVGRSINQAAGASGFRGDPALRLSAGIRGGLPWWMQVLVVLRMSLVGVAYRKKLTSWANSGVGGVGEAAKLPQLES